MDLTSPVGASAAWRQLVDLIGRGRVPADGWALATLQEVRARVPLAARAASARALFGAAPPIALVSLLAADDIAVAAPILRSAALSDRDWATLLPQLTPTARAIVRHRRDLTPGVERALASFGAIDFVIAGAGAPIEAAEAEAAPSADAPVAVDAGPFVSLGTIARGLPLVAEALRRENDNEAPAPDGTFRIADVVARLEAFQQGRGPTPAGKPAVEAPAGEEFRFETDATGVIRGVDGRDRGAIVGIGIAMPARPASAGVDGTAAGAFRRRAAFRNANLIVVSAGAAGGRWLISAEPGFDPRTGRFVGYLGRARRPDRHEGFASVAPRSDSLRQLVHELRTPTNAIAGFSEMIEHQLLGPVADAYRDQAATMRGDAGRLLAAIDDLDTAARIDADALQLRFETLSMASLLGQVVHDLTPLIAARGVRFTVEDAQGSVQADARSLDRLMARLIGAVVGAADRGEAITVRSVATAGDTVVLDITRPRTWNGLADDQLLAMRDEDSPATLLGTAFALRLVRSLARTSGGSADFGTHRVTLHLPTAAGRPVDRARNS